jgi:uncharacterized protein (DUF983 family)
LTQESVKSENYYPPLSPVKTGLAGKCPRCGRGNLFDGYLAVAEACRNCGLSFDFADGGDGAAWFVLLIVGFLGVGTILGIEAAYQPPYWVHAIAAVPLLIVLPLILLRPVKGILICQQWKTRAREGRLDR